MITLDRRIAAGGAAATVTLTLEQRVRSRLRVTLDDGREAGVFLARGETLRDGDLLGDADGLIVHVRAAAETLSEARCDDPLLLARAAYHLGNRHVALQIAPGWLRYGHDHVLDAMLAGMGLAPTVVEAPFEPEPGAYGAAGHGDRHGDGHEHGPGGHAH
jgi:urease accessory protein